MQEIIKRDEERARNVEGIITEGKKEKANRGGLGKEHYSSEVNRRAAFQQQKEVHRLKETEDKKAWRGGDSRDRGSRAC